MNEMIRTPENRSVWGVFDDFDNLFDDFWRPVRNGRVTGANNGAFAPALEAAEWMLRHRSAPGGGFSDAGSGRAGGTLGANLAMARALLQLYRVTGTPRFLDLARNTGARAAERFHHPAGGYLTGRSGPDGREYAPQIDENICFGRFLNLLHHYTGDTACFEQARHRLRFLASPQVATSRMEEAGILLLDEELSSTPLKITIMGSREDTGVAKLRQAALRTFGWYKVIHGH